MEHITGKCWENCENHQQWLDVHYCPDCGAGIHCICCEEFGVPKLDGKEYQCIKCFAQSPPPPSLPGLPSSNNSSIPQVRVQSYPNSTDNHVTRNVITKRMRKDGGFKIQGPFLPLTPGASDRHSFVQPALETLESTRLSSEELAVRAEKLFYTNRIFLNKQCLCDALNQFGMGYFSVCGHGMSYECSAGPKHEKKTKHSLDDSESSGSESLDVVGQKKVRGKGKASIKLGCQFKIQYSYVKKKDYNGSVVITGGSYTHDKCQGSLEVYRAVIQKSHSPFHALQHDGLIQLLWM